MIASPHKLSCVNVGGSVETDGRTDEKLLREWNEEPRESPELSYPVLQNDNGDPP